MRIFRNFRQNIKIDELIRYLKIYELIKLGIHIKVDELATSYDKLFTNSKIARTLIPADILKTSKWSKNLLLRAYFLFYWWSSPANRFKRNCYLTVYVTSYEKWRDISCRREITKIRVVKKKEGYSKCNAFSTEKLRCQT